MTHIDPFEYLPRILPEQDIVVDEEEHHYVENDEFYTPRKAPFYEVREITGTVNGSSFTFEQGIDFETTDTDGDGALDTIDWSVGGENPDPDTIFYVTYRCESVLTRYVAAHNEVADHYSHTEIQDVIDSHQVDNATGDQLDEIGALFGEIGRRRGRTDDEYRALLKSIVQSFSGRGTVPGMKFAIAAGIGTDPENIKIDEDFTKVGYEIRIENVDTTFLSSVVNSMAQLSDPSGVELLSDPIIVNDGDVILFVPTESTETDSDVGLGGNVLTLDGNSLLGSDHSGGTTTSATGSSLTATNL